MVRKRVTVWPGMRVPLPLVPWSENTRLWRGEHGLWVDFNPPTIEAELVWENLEAEVPRDLYLRELGDLNVDSPEAVCAFIREHGWLEPPDWENDFDLFEEELVHQSHEDNENRHLEEGRWSWEKTRIASPRQVGAGLAVVRDMVTLWLAVSDRLTLDEALARLHPGILSGQLVSEYAADTHRDFLFGSLLERLLDWGLQPFHVTVRINASLETWLEEISLFNVLCLALANDIADAVDFKRCANEACGSFFTRQEGRAEKGHYHMAGVKYCSVKCAMAQKQREYRRRKQAERRGP